MVSCRLSCPDLWVPPSGAQHAWSPRPRVPRHLLDEVAGSRGEAAGRAGIGRSTLYRWLQADLLEVPLCAEVYAVVAYPPGTTLKNYKSKIKSYPRQGPGGCTRP
jgi:hypothetical protein